MRMELDSLIGDIYDCAANPDLWPVTLGKLRDFGDFAYVLIGYLDNAMDGGFRPRTLKYSKWDAVWMQRLQEHIPTIPHLDRLFRQGIDAPWIQMDQMPEVDFRRSSFFRDWVEPQNLRDGMNTLFIDRKVVQGVMVMTRHESRPLMGERERQIAAAVSPHIRRAIAINEIVDKTQLAVALYRRVLDALSASVLVLGPAGKLVYANAGGERMLSTGDILRLSAGRVVTTRTDIAGAPFDSAIARATRGDAAVGISGIGVPLVGISGERAAAYVLPTGGNDLRRELSDGHAIVFIARRGEQQPLAIEILRTVFGLTPMEARVAYATSLGEGGPEIAGAFGISLETVRSHLKQAYIKVDVPGKLALAARINVLIPPVDAASPPP